MCIHITTCSQAFPPPTSLHRRQSSKQMVLMYKNEHLIDVYVCHMMTVRMVNGDLLKIQRSPLGGNPRYKIPDLAPGAAAADSQLASHLTYHTDRPYCRETEDELGNRRRRIIDFLTCASTPNRLPGSFLQASLVAIRQFFRFK